MNIVYMIICGFMLLLAGGCTRKGADLNPENQDFIVHLKGEVASRVHLGEGNGSYPVLWESGDRIIVFGGTEQQPGSIYVTDDGECRTARFRHDGSIPGNPHPAGSGLYTAIYPANAEYQNGSITFSIPEVQHYREGGIGKDSWPMVGISNKHEMSFNGVCSLLKLRLHALDTHSISSINVGSVQDIGKRMCRYSAATGAEWEPGTQEETKIGQITSLDCSDALPELTAEPKDFYIAVPPGRHTGLAFQLNTCNGEHYLYLVPDATEFKRNTITMFDLPFESFMQCEDSPVETGKTRLNIVGLRYSLTADKIAGNDSTKLILKSFREAMIDNGASIREPVGWHALFSTDAGQTYTETPTEFFRGFNAAGTGSIKGETICSMPADSTGKNLVKFIQNVSGKSVSAGFD